MTDVHCCVISGFHHEVGGTRTLLGCYAATSGNLTKCCPATSVRSYQYSLCNKPDERSSFLMYAVVCNGFELSRIRTNQDTQGNIFLRGIKGRKMRWAGPVTGKGEKWTAYRVLVREPEGNRPFWKPRSKWVTNQNFFQEEIRSREFLLSFGEESLIFQFAIQKFKDKDIQNYYYAFCFVWVWNLVTDIEGGT